MIQIMAGRERKPLQMEVVAHKDPVAYIPHSSNGVLVNLKKKHKVFPYDAQGTCLLRTGLYFTVPIGYRLAFEPTGQVMSYTPVRPRALIAGSGELIVFMDNVSRHPYVLQDKMPILEGHLVPLVTCNVELVNVEEGNLEEE